MAPQDHLASTEYCLANTGHEYLVYLPEGGAVTVDLSSAKTDLAAEWLTINGKTIIAGPIKGGARRSLKPPFTGAAVLYLKSTGQNP